MLRHPALAHKHNVVCRFVLPDVTSALLGGNTYTWAADHTYQMWMALVSGCGVPQLLVCWVVALGHVGANALLYLRAQTARRPPQGLAGVRRSVC